VRWGPAGASSTDPAAGGAENPHLNVPGRDLKGIHIGDGLSSAADKVCEGDRVS